MAYGRWYLVPCVDWAQTPAVDLPQMIDTLYLAQLLGSTLGPAPRRLCEEDPFHPHYAERCINTRYQQRARRRHPLAQ